MALPARVAGWPQVPSELRAGMAAASDIGVDSRGLVYVARRTDHPLLCLNPDGTLQRTLGDDVHRPSICYDLTVDPPMPMPEKIWLHGLSVDADDNVWVTDAGRHLVFKFDPSGELAMTLGQDGVPGDGDDQFNQPTHVAVAPAGDIFVSDGYGNSRIVHFAADGTFIKTWGRPGVGPGEFHTPHTIVMDAAGLLYVSDRENNRIQIFDQGGNLQGIWPDLRSVDALSIGPDGRIYGGAGLDRSIIRLSPDGTLLDRWGPPGWIEYPHGLCVDPAGDMFVVAGGIAKFNATP